MRLKLLKKLRRRVRVYCEMFYIALFTVTLTVATCSVVVISLRVKLNNSEKEIETLKFENKELLRTIDMKTHQVIILNNEVAKYHKRRPDAYLKIDDFKH